MANTDHDEIEEADVEENASAPSEALNMIELEQSIKTFYSGLAMKRQELRKFTEMIKHTLETDKTYAVQEEEVQEVKQKQQKIKDQLMSLPSVVSAKEDMKELREEIKDLQELLSKKLLEYYEVTQQKSITMTDGETYELKPSVKLVKQKS